MVRAAVPPDAPTITDTVTSAAVAAEATAFTCKVCAPPSSLITVTAVEVSDASTKLRVIDGVVCPAAGTATDKNAAPNTDATPKPATNNRRIVASFSGQHRISRISSIGPTRPDVRKRYPPPQFVKLNLAAPRPAQTHNSEAA